MSFAKALSEITETDIRALGDAQTPEGKLLNYKREMPGPTDGDKREFLFDISSFANAVSSPSAFCAWLWSVYRGSFSSGSSFIIQWAMVKDCPGFLANSQNL
jgi:hypothetical protein